MNCSGVKYVNKCLFGGQIECWLLDKVVRHVRYCGECKAYYRAYGEAVSEHVNECERCNREYRFKAS